MRKIIMVLIMAMVAFGSFAKSFEYKANDEEWSYNEESRALFQDYKFQYDTGDYLHYNISYFDVSEEDAWKIINGEEFPTFEFCRSESGVYTYIDRMPCRDYSNRR